MSKKDEDIRKLKEYAFRVGISVRILKYYRKANCLGYYSQGSHIVVFKASNTYKIDIIMTLLHEIGHHLDWLETKRGGKEFEKAYGFTTGKPAKVKNIEERRKYSKIILDSEKAAISYMPAIAKSLNLSISQERIRKQQKIDLFHYIVLHKRGKFPSSKEVRDYERLILNEKI